MEIPVLPQDYVLAMTPEEIKIKWPNLILTKNFHYTSRKKKGYNCVAYAIGEAKKDIDMLYFKDKYKLNPNTLDHSAKGYASFFSTYYGFEICDDILLEDGYEKIVLYENAAGDFLHLALQLDNGHWTSKMGSYEDIEHYTLESVAGEFYGYPSLYMKRVKQINLTHIQESIKF